MPFDKIRQAIAAIGCEAIASHRSAAFLWDLIPESDHIDVLITRAHRPRDRAGIIVHRASALPESDISVRAGMRCTNPLRTLADLGAVAPQLVPPALSTAAVSRLVVPEAARAALERISVRGRPGLGALRAALADCYATIGCPGSRSTRSSRATRLTSLTMAAEW